MRTADPFDRADDAAGLFQHPDNGAMPVGIAHQCCAGDISGKSLSCSEFIEDFFSVFAYYAGQYIQYVGLPDREMLP
jgi:hypothetical protein